MSGSEHPRLPVKLAQVAWYDPRRYRRWGTIASGIALVWVIYVVVSGASLHTATKPIGADMAAVATYAVDGHAGALPSTSPPLDGTTLAAALGPVHCKVGLYVTALHDSDLLTNSFQADVWVWSVCPNASLTPLTTMEFTNADSVTESLAQTTTEPGGSVYSSMKVTGQFRQEYDLTAYPFDRQHLQIQLEDADSTTGQLVYSPDTSNSGCLAHLKLDDWSVTACSVSVNVDRYATTFGDPTLQPGTGSSYSRLTFTVDASRSDPVAEYFKATAVLYAAMLMALISFLLLSEHHSLMSPRVSIVGLAVFAAALSMESESAQLNVTNHFALVDAIGVETLLCIVVAGFAAVGCQIFLDREMEFTKVRRLNYISMYITLALFLVINVALVLLFRG
jgi:hypothetical protein